MTESLGFGTAFFNTEVNEWEGAEAISATEDEVLYAIRSVLESVGMTEEEFENADPLYLTEVVRTRQLTWEDVKTND